LEGLRPSKFFLPVTATFVALTGRAEDDSEHLEMLRCFYYFFTDQFKPTP
jgi:hypothetical protein